MARGLEGAAIGGICLQSRSCQRKRTSPSLRRRNWLGFPKENTASRSPGGVWGRHGAAASPPGGPGGRGQPLISSKRSNLLSRSAQKHPVNLARGRALAAPPAPDSFPADGRGRGRRTPARPARGQRLPPASRWDLRPLHPPAPGPHLLKGERKGGGEPAVCPYFADGLPAACAAAADRLAALPRAGPGGARTRTRRPPPGPGPDRRTPKALSPPAPV